MLLALEGWVTNLEESVSGMKETLEIVEGCTTELDSMKEHLKEYVTKSLNSNMHAIPLWISKQ